MTDTSTRAPSILRTSTLPYLSVIIVGLTLALYLQYLWQYFAPGLPVIKGQSPGIWVSGVTTAVAIGLWLLLPLRPARNRWAQAFLTVTLAGWVIRLALAFMHGDQTNYTVWLYPVIIVLLWLKFPTAAELRAGLLVLGWTGSLLLVWTRFSELTGIYPMAPVAPELVAFEVGEYWLPLSGWLGPEGRWPGPLGGTAFTGILGALLIVLAFAVRSRSSWVFGAVGILTLLLTSSRGAYAATGAGVAVAVLFSDWKSLRRLRFWMRAVIAAVGAALTLGLVIRTNTGLTGRTSFWPEFLDLWRSSPLTGVGTSGYQDGTVATQISGTAHSFYVDELARNGLLGFLALITGFVVAAVLCVMAAKALNGGPLALLATVAVLGIANTPFAWLSPSLLWLFYVLPVLWAASLLAEPEALDHRDGSRGAARLPQAR